MVSVDGVRGVGKSTQTSYLCNLLAQKYPKVIRKTINNNSLEIIEECMDILDKDSETVIVVDGFISRDIIYDWSHNMPLLEIEEKYKDLIHKLRVLDHKYRTLSIILNPDRLDWCRDRFFKFLSLREMPLVEYSLAEESNLLSGFRRFDNLSITQNLKFNLIDVFEDESIMEISKKIQLKI